eukprot:m.184389 g.184389  ORF g.184389 m.184389 type:complete len:259 (-) comp14710_c2_seq23:1952-2728(-)
MSFRSAAKRACQFTDAAQAEQAAPVEVESQLVDASVLPSPPSDLDGEDEDHEDMDTDAFKDQKAGSKQPQNALDALMASSAKKASATPAATASSDSYRPTWGWASVFVDLVKNPERFSSMIVFQDADVIIVRDKFPKAKYHFLVLPTQQIDDIFQLRREHCSLIKTLQKRAMQFGQEIQKLDTRATFKTGFHAVPSMKQVHLHLISTDFVSPGLKTKKHWNSFNTPYFVHPRGDNHKNDHNQKTCTTFGKRGRIRKLS